MNNSGLPFGTGRNLGLMRASEAMLRALGGHEVILRFAFGRDVQTDALAPRLGLSPAQCEEVPVSPVLVRDATAGTSKIEILFPAGPVQNLAEARQSGSAQALFESALDVVHGGRPYRVLQVNTDFYGGSPYLYRVLAVATGTEKGE